MAEGWARHLRGDRLEAFSAGIEPLGLNPLAVRVMAESGVDISRQNSKRLDDLADVRFDRVVTVCDNANERCPVLPDGVKKVHVAFDDPPKLAARASSEEQALVHYRRIRDEIRSFIETLPDALG